MPPSPSPVPVQPAGAGAKDGEHPGWGEGITPSRGRERSEPGGYPAIVPSNERDELMDTLYRRIRIPGMGVCLPRCSEPEYARRTVICSADPSHHHMEVQGSSCGRVECPQCHKTWENRAADRAGARIEGYQRCIRAPPKHVIFSLSAEEAATLGYGKAPMYVIEKKAKAILLKRAEEVGITGGAAIFHPWRFNKRNIPIEALQLMKANSAVRANPDKFSEWMTFEPHLHLVAFGWLEKVKKGGGFQYKNKGSLRSREDIERVVRYALTHTWIDLDEERQKHKVTYFGRCSYRKLKPIRLHQVKQERVCPVCGAVLIYDDTRRVFYDRLTVADGWVIVKDIHTTPSAEVFT